MKGMKRNPGPPVRYYCERCGSAGRGTECWFCGNRRLSSVGSNIRWGHPHVVEFPPEPTRLEIEALY